MKYKYIFLIFCLIISYSTKAQEQFTKKFDITFKNATLYDALLMLGKTQANMSYAFGPDDADMKKSTPVTLDLHNVTFDQAMDKILTTQSIYKDYYIVDFGGEDKMTVLHLSTESRLNDRYIDRHVNKGKYYHVGDELPDFAYTAGNYSSDKLKLSDFKGKLVILVLWNINCEGCIEAMPEFNYLQNKLKDKIQIILVTKDSKNDVDKLKKRVKIVGECQLPFITGENALGSLFNYTFVPTEVWINPSGKVSIITLKNIAAEKYINEFLSGKSLGIYELKDTVLTSNYQRTMSCALQPITQGDYGISTYMASHNSTRYDYHGYMGGFTDTSIVKSVSYEGADLYLLYREAYKGYGSAGNTGIRFINKLDNPTKYDSDGIGLKNFFDYELITRRKEIDSSKFYRLMQQQLDAYFGISSSFEKRDVQYYALVSISKTDHLKSSKNGEGMIFNDNILVAKNTTLAEILDFINSQRSNLLSPLINLTALNQGMRVDLKMNVDFDNNLAAVNEDLANYGLAIVKKFKQMDCIILKDN